MAKESRELARVPALLATITRSKRQLALAKDLDEVLKIRDQAEAMRQVIKTARAGLSAQNAAAELKILAERKAGELLAKNIPHKGGRPAKNTNTMLAFPPLKDIGVEQIESHRLQRMAALPEKEFQRYLIETTEAGEELTSAEVRRRAKHYLRSKKQSEHAVNGAERAKGIIVTDIDALAGKTFGTIYADPPWQYGNQATRAATDRHYKTMTPAELCAMPVGDLAADDAHLHLWTTNAFLRESFDVIAAWGFEYRSVFVWCKPQMGIGNYWRVSHEFLMLGVRGDAKQFGNHEQMSYALIDRTKHSRKPEGVREKIEMVSFGPYLELFGRRPVDGWTVFGNELEPDLFVK